MADPENGTKSSILGLLPWNWISGGGHSLTIHYPPTPFHTWNLTFGEMVLILLLQGPFPERRTVPAVKRVAGKHEVLDTGSEPQQLQLCHLPPHRVAGESSVEKSAARKTRLGSIAPNTRAIN